MNKVIGGIIMVAPNGVTKVRVFRHGYIEPLEETFESDEQWKRVQDLITLARDNYPKAFGKKGKPRQIMEFMGWTKYDKPTSPERDEEGGVVNEIPDADGSMEFVKIAGLKNDLR